MAGKADKRQFRRIRLEGTREALVVFLLGGQFVTVREIQELGGELMAAADTAIAIDMPMVLSFEGVETVSSALIGKLVLLRKKLHSSDNSLKMVGMSPEIEKVFRRAFPGGGPNAA